MEKSYARLFTLVNVMFFIFITQLAAFALPPLSGNFTIGGASPDYLTISEAITELAAMGVEGPTTFLIRDGSYQEQISLGVIPGASVDNPITFRSESLDSSMVVISYDSPSNANYIVNLNNSDYLTFEHLTFESIDASYGRIFNLIDTVENLIIQNCALIGANTNEYHIYGNNIETFNLTIRNSRFENNRYGIFLDGTSNGSEYIHGLLVENNIFNNMDRSAIYTNLFRSPIIKNNQIYSSSTSANNYKIEMNNAYDSIIVENNILDWPAGGYGLAVDANRTSTGTGDCIIANNNITVDRNVGITINGAGNALGAIQLLRNKVLLDNGSFGIQYYYDATVNRRSIIANNFVNIKGSQTSKYGFYGSSFFYTNIYNNTFHINSTVGNNYAYWESCGRYSDLVNNVFSVTGNGYSLYVTNCYSNVFNRIGYNGYYADNELFHYRGNNYTDFQSYQNAWPIDSHSIFAPPFFLDIDSFDIAQIKFDGSALPLTDVPTDITGLTRDATNPDIGCAEFMAIGMDAGISIIDPPAAPFAAGVQEVTAIVNNYGTDDLTNVQVVWDVNGVIQDTLTWTGTLTSDDTTEITLGDFDFQININHNIRAWTILPNGMADPIMINDTTEIENIYAGLAGTYTLGGTAPDILDFKVLENHLRYGGVLDSVFIDVRDGTYNEQLNYRPAIGSDVSKPVIVRSESGDSSAVVLAYNSPSTANYVLILNGIDNIRFERITFQSLSSTYGRIITLLGTVNNLAFRNCVFKATDTNDYMIYGNNVVNENTEITNCLFDGNGYAIHLDGTTNGSNYVPGLVIEDNQMLNQRTRAIYSRYHRTPSIQRNYTSSNQSSASGVIYMDDTYDGGIVADNQIDWSNGGSGMLIEPRRSSLGILGDMEILRNNITVRSSYGLYITGSGSANGGIKVLENKISVSNGTHGLDLRFIANSTNRGLVANNFIYIGGTLTKYGLHGSSHRYLDIYHNSINVNSTSGAGYAYWDACGNNNNVVNNIFSVQKGSGYALYNTNCSGSYDRISHNAYYSPGGQMGHNGAVYPDLETYQAQTGLDSNSVYLNPYFINDTSFQVAQSGLKNAGFLLDSITTDIEGESRDSLRDIGADEFDLIALDAGIMEIVTPTIPFPAGIHVVYASLKNFGTEILNTVDLHWKLNGVDQPVINWTGNLESGDTILVNLTDLDFQIATKYRIDAGTQMPNSMIDPVMINDTAFIDNVYAGLAGTYTLGGTDPDFLDLLTAKDELNFGGVYGPVIFDIRDGEYIEQISFNKFPGSNPINKVTFRSENQDSSLVSIRWDSPSTSDYTIRLNGTDHIEFEHLTLASQDASYGNVIVLLDTVEHFTVKNCAFESVSNFDYMIYGENVETYYPNLLNNRFTGNGYGVRLDGTTNGNQYMPGTVIENNIFENQYYYEIYTRYHTGQKILNNTLYSTNTSTSWKINLDDAFDAIELSGNEILGFAARSGINIDARRSTNGTGDVVIYKNVIEAQSGTGMTISGTATSNGTLVMTKNRINVLTGAYGLQYYYDAIAGSRALLANNFIHVGGTATKYGFYGSSFFYTDIFHNTINVSSATGTGYAYWESCGRFTDLANNILNVIGNGQAMSVNNCYTNVFVRSDHNNYKNSNGNIITYRGNSYATIPDFTNAWQLDSNSVSLDPLFVNDTTDLHVTNVLLDKLGTHVPAVTTDIDGDVRDLIRPDIGADEFTTEQNDISIINLNSPQDLFPAGNTPVTVSVLNNGLDSLKSFSIKWDINGETQVDYDWVGEVMSGESVDSLTIGSYSFEIDSNYTITLITENPNGVVDGFPQDDTLRETNVYAALGGTYTIGGIDPDFETFERAVTALKNGGVIDSVIFNVRDGIYNERLIIPEIEGASDIQKITFQSESGVADDVELKYVTSDTDSTFVIILSGADYINFKNITINSTGAVLARVINIRDGANDNTFEGNRIISNIINTTNTSHDLVIVPSNQRNERNTFLNNHFIGGSTAISYQSITSYSKDVAIIGNTFEKQYRRAIYCTYLQNLTVSKNIISNVSNYSSYYGIDVTAAGQNVLIDGNKINVQNGVTGIYLVSYNDQGTMLPAIVSNNFVRGGGTNAIYGIRINASNYVKVVYNTVSLTNASASSQAIRMDSGIEHYLYNNNLVNFGQGQTIFTSSPSYITDSDHNNLFTNGSIFAYYGSNVSNLAAWQAATGFAANSLSVDPLFESDSSFLPLEIELNNAGISVEEVSFDIEGDPRDPATPDIGADEFTLVIPNDIGVIEILSPSSSIPFSGVNEEVKVVLRNNGSNIISSASINSVIDSVLQFPFSWTGTLQPGERDTVIIGTTNLSFNASHDIVAYSSSPNGVADITPSNDTTKVLDLYVGLIGIYTIGGVLPDFNSITEAVNALNNGGVLGAVEFRIRNGSYNEQLLIEQIEGVNADSPVKFVSESGDPSLVKIEFTGTSGMPFTIRLNGSDYITFENLSLESLSTNYGSVIYIQGNANNNVFTNNLITGSPTTNDDLIYSPSTSNDNHNHFIGNTFVKGGRAIDFRGVNGNNKQPGTLIENNIFIDQSSESIYLDDNNDAQVIANTFSFDERNPNSTSISIYDCDGQLVIARNQITRLQGSGIIVQFYNEINSLTQGRITNNMVSIGGTSGATGIYLNSSSDLELIYNSIHLYNTNTTSKALYVRSGFNNIIKNNILANTGNGYAYYVEGNSVDVSDNNNIFSVGANLGYWINSNQADLAAWQAASGKDLNSISLNPLFFSDENLHVLQVGLDGAAEVIPGLNVDIEGDMRDATNPDIGADEFDFITDDLGVIAIIGLQDDCDLSNAEQITVVIQNYGGLPQSNFDLAIVLNGVTNLVENIGNIVVPPGDTIHYKMNNIIDLSDYGIYTIDAFTNLTGDLNLENNSFNFQVQNFQQPDVPGNLLPSDGQMDVGKPINLSWLPSTGATLYDLYIWADSLPQPATPYFNNLTQISAVINASEFVFGVEYAWQVIAKNPNCITPSAIQTFTLRELPDLIPTNITVPNNPFSSQEILVSWNVENMGTGATLDETWFDQVYLSPDNAFNPSVDTYLGAIANLTALEVNESYAHSMNVTLPDGITGTWYVFIIPNGYNSIPESNTANNPVGVPIQIALTPPPDLIVSQIIPPNNAFSGTEVMVTFEVTNDGDGDTEEGAWRDYMYISDQAMFNLNDATLLTIIEQTGNLEAGQSYQKTALVDLPDEIFGDYFIHVFTDRQNQVFEFAFNDNNVATSDTVNIFLTPPPDLELTSFTLPDTLSPSETVNAFYKVSNTGATAAVGGWRDRIYISEVDSFDASARSMVTYTSTPSILNAGDDYQVSRNFNMPADETGDIYVYFRTDYRNAIFEFNSEANNILRSNAIAVIAPDLQVDNISGPANSISGSMVDITWTNVNDSRGTASNRQIIDSIYVSLSSTFDNTAIPIFKLNHTPALGPEELKVQIESMQLPNGIAGNYYIHVKTDAIDGLFEANENNNISSSAQPISIGLAPSSDLRVTAFSNLPDTVRAITQTVSLQFNVANMGVAGTTGSGWKDKLYLSTEPVWNDTSSNNYLLKEFERFNMLLPGENYDLVANTNFPMVSLLLPGETDAELYLYAVADDEDDLYEHQSLNENNVLRSPPIFVQCPPPVDLDNTMLSTIPMDTLETSQELTLSWMIENLGSSTALWDYDIWYDGVYLSNDPIWDPSDMLIEDFTQEGPLDSLGYYTDEQTITIPEVPSGTYCLMLVADNQEYLKDGDFTNNVDIFPVVGSPNVYIKQKVAGNLVAKSFTAPVNGTSGQPIDIVLKVKNEGPGPIDEGWVDKIYLSTDFVISNDDIILNTNVKAPSLLPGEEYQDTVKVFIPIEEEGNFILLFKTDANNRVFEMNEEADNSLFTFISIERDDPSDLIVESAVLPSSVFVNEKIDLSYITKNIGQFPASGIQRDIVYLSQDSIFDVTDIQLGIQELSSQLAPNASENRDIQMLCTPGVPLGDYHVIVQVDALNNIYEVSDDNNVFISPGKVNVQVEELPIDVLTPNTIIHQTSLFYRIEIPAALQNETMRVTITSDNINANNEMYLSLNEMPTRAAHDYSHSIPFSPNQDVTVPELDSGTYYLHIYGESNIDQPQNISVIAEIIEFEIRSIEQNEGGNTGSVTAKITGAKFSENMTVSLHDPTLGTYVASSLYFLNSTEVFATFNLGGANLGVYDVLLEKPGGASVSLEDGFTIVEGPVVSSDVFGNDSNGFVCNIKNLGTENLLSSNIIAPSAVRVGRIVPITIQFGNNGTMDIPCPQRFILSVRGAPLGFTPDELSEMKQQLLLTFGEVGGPPGILRPGATGSITIYSFSSHPLRFYIQE